MKTPRRIFSNCLTQHIPVHSMPQMKSSSSPMFVMLHPHSEIIAGKNHNLHPARTVPSPEHVSKHTQNGGVEMWIPFKTFLLMSRVRMIRIQRFSDWESPLTNRIDFLIPVSIWRVPSRRIVFSLMFTFPNLLWIIHPIRHCRFYFGYTAAAMVWTLFRSIILILVAGSKDYYPGTPLLKASANSIIYVAPNYRVLPTSSSN